MVTTDYVSYSIALALKKAGFDWPCDYYWYKVYTDSDKMEMRQASADDYWAGYQQAIYDLFGAECLSDEKGVDITKLEKETADSLNEWMGSREGPKSASPNANHSDIDMADLIAKGCVPDPAKLFKFTPKEDSLKQCRLNIMAMMAQSILSNNQLLSVAIETYQKEAGSTDIFQIVAMAAKAQADAIMAQNEV